MEGSRTVYYREQCTMQRHRRSSLSRVSRTAKLPAAPPSTKAITTTETQTCIYD